MIPTPSSTLFTSPRSRSGLGVFIAAERIFETSSRRNPLLRSLSSSSATTSPTAHAEKASKAWLRIGERWDYDSNKGGDGAGGRAMGRSGSGQKGDFAWLGRGGVEGRLWKQGGSGGGVVESSPSVPSPGHKDASSSSGGASSSRGTRSRLKKSTKAVRKPGSKAATTTTSPPPGRPRPRRPYQSSALLSSSLYDLSNSLAERDGQDVDGTPTPSTSATDYSRVSVRSRSRSRDTSDTVPPMKRKTTTTKRKTPTRTKTEPSLSSRLLSMRNSEHLPPHPAPEPELGSPTTPLQLSRIREFPNLKKKEKKSSPGSIITSSQSITPSDTTSSPTPSPSEPPSLSPTNPPPKTTPSHALKPKPFLTRKRFWGPLEFSPRDTSLPLSIHPFPRITTYPPITTPSVIRDQLVRDPLWLGSGEKGRKLRFPMLPNGKVMVAGPNVYRRNGWSGRDVGLPDKWSFLPLKRNRDRK